MRLFLRFWFPVFFYSAIIFLISSLPSSQLKSTVQIWDKLLHVLEYAPLGFLMTRALRGSRAWPKATIWLVSVVFCYFYGLTDEFHQSFIPGREAVLADALADFVGGAFGAGTYLFVQQRFNYFKKEVSLDVST